METRERMEDARDNLEDWIRKAVKEAQDEVLKDDPRLDDSDLRRITEINEKMKEDGEGSLWNGVDIRIYIDEDDETGDETVELDTFGVPSIPPEMDVDDDRRELYNSILSDYGVAVSESVEEEFEEWSEGRKQA